MATISDILKRINDTLAVSVDVTFESYGGPWPRSDGLTIRDRITVTSHATTAVITTPLREGYYRVQCRKGPAWSLLIIVVPSGSGTYGLLAIAVVTDPTSTYRNVFDSAADLLAFTVAASVALVILHQDSNNPPALDIIFLRSTHANVLAWTPDGVVVARDASNARFLKQGVNPADLI